MRRERNLLLAAVMAAASTASAGTFTSITVDGDMADWASVPVLITDGVEDGSPIDIGTVQMANDAENLYIRISYHTPVNPNVGPSIFLAFDTDSNVATGFNIYGLNTVGSEAGFQNDFPFDQRTGFNVGALTAAAAISPVDFANPSNVFSSQEYSIPRSLAYATDNLPVFANPGFNLMLWTDSGTLADVTSAIPYAFASPVVEASWTAAGNGAWSGASNWSIAAVPNDAMTKVRFGGAVAGATTVTVDGDYTTAGITFDNASARYTLNRANANASLNVVGAITVSAGSHTLAVDTKATSLDLSASGVQLDVSNAVVAIDYTSGSSPYAALIGVINTGKLVSTVGSSSRAVGMVEASDLGVTTLGDLTVDGDALLIRGTLAGDSNLDLNVDFDDLLKLAQAYGSSTNKWFNGDFDYSGNVDFDDLLALAQNYGRGALSASQIAQLDIVAGEAFRGDWALALSLAPEPSSLLMAGAASLLVRRRR